MHKCQGSGQWVSRVNLTSNRREASFLLGRDPPPRKSQKRPREGVRLFGDESSLIRTPPTGPSLPPLGPAPGLEGWVVCAALLPLLLGFPWAGMAWMAWMDAWGV